MYAKTKRAFSFFIAHSKHMERKSEWKIRQKNSGEVMKYLIANKLCPKPSHGSLIRIFGKQRVVLPCLLDVFEDDKGLGNRLATVNEHRDFFMNRVALKKQWTLSA